MEEETGNETEFSLVQLGPFVVRNGILSSRGYSFILYFSTF